MTVDEARQLLGLPSLGDDDVAASSAAPETALELRKAYVAAIKRFRPEQHPKEFQRIRVAWQRLVLALEEAQDAAHALPREFTPTPTELAVPGPPPLSFVSRDEEVSLTGDELQRPVTRDGVRPSWETHEDELVELLCALGVLAWGPRMTTSLSEAERARLVQLAHAGWAPAFDAPLTRAVGRLFELGHHYEGHLVFEQLWILQSQPRHERDPMSPRQKQLVQKLGYALAGPMTTTTFDWLFDVAWDPPGPAATDLPIPPVPRGTSCDDFAYGDSVAFWAAVIVCLFALLWLGRWAA